VYPFESIQQTKGVTPAQGYNGPPLVETVKYVTICNKIIDSGTFINLAFPPRRGGLKSQNKVQKHDFSSTGWRKSRHLRTIHSQNFKLPLSTSRMVLS
jgi:hypothetical protein